MTIKKKAKRQKMIWLWGNKMRGVSVYKLHYKTPQWRVAF